MKSDFKNIILKCIADIMYHTGQLSVNLPSVTLIVVLLLALSKPADKE